MSLFQKKKKKEKEVIMMLFLKTDGSLILFVDFKFYTKMKKKDNQYIKLKENYLLKIRKNSLGGKISPKDEELERVIIGAVLLEKSALNMIIEILSPEDFYLTNHQIIYRSICDLFNNSKPIDLMTVVDHLRKKDFLKSVGGPKYLAQLTNNVASSANIEYYARIIIELSIKRKIIRIASEMQNDAYEDSIDIFDLLESSGKSFFEILESNIRQNCYLISSVAKSALLSLDKKLNGICPGIYSGFQSLDKIITGWLPSNLIILAARPGMGKTAFLLSTIRNAIIDQNKPVAFFSIEMSKEELFNRLVAAESEIDIKKIQQGNINKVEHKRIIDANSFLSNSSLFIDDTPALSVFELRAKCRILKSQHDIQLVVVDYLQLMRDENIKNNSNREQEIASISRALKSIAKELNIPIIAASQLSRAVETRGGDKRPQLSDLRESGAIEQDADIVMFLYRPEYYGIIQEDKNGNAYQGYSEIKVAKHRNGPVGNAIIKYISKLTKFINS